MQNDPSLLINIILNHNLYTKFKKQIIKRKINNKLNKKQKNNLNIYITKKVFTVVLKIKNRNSKTQKCFFKVIDDVIRKIFDKI